MNARRGHQLKLITPDWPVPPVVRALVSTRCGGVSTGSYAALNLGTHVGDDAVAVSENRRRLRAVLPTEPVWLEQVHGIEVVDADGVAAGSVPTGDAAVARQAGVVCAVMTADCLPVLFASDDGEVVAVAHAGWRGLQAGVLEATVAAMGVAPHRILAWLGPAIGPRAFEVGEEVRQAFVSVFRAHDEAFSPTGHAGKWWADIYRLARQRLALAGVSQIHGGGECTWHDPDRFFSYRRDGTTGRFVTLTWRAPPGAPKRP